MRCGARDEAAEVAVEHVVAAGEAGVQRHEPVDAVVVADALQQQFVASTLAIARPLRAA